MSGTQFFFLILMLLVREICKSYILHLENDTWKDTNNTHRFQGFPKSSEKLLCIFLKILAWGTKEGGRNLQNGKTKMYRWC